MSRIFDKIIVIESHWKVMNIEGRVTQTTSSATKYGIIKIKSSTDPVKYREIEFSSLNSSGKYTSKYADYSYSTNRFLSALVVKDDIKSFLPAKALNDIKRLVDIGLSEDLKNLLIELDV
jgi:hypothetical protein